MAVQKEYNGRIFSESKYFQPVERRIAGMSQNHVWLYAVELGSELDKNTDQISDKTIVRIVRWRAINESSKGDKIWRYQSSYNIRSGEEWQTTSNIVDQLINAKIQDNGFIPVPVEQYNKLYASSLKYKSANSEKRKMLGIIRELKNISSITEAELCMFKQKLSLMISNVQDLELIIRKYRKLISNLDTTETQVHDFLINHKAFWMFGLEYVRIESKVDFPPGKNYYEFDLMLQRYDGFFDLVELKGPNENLFDKRTNKRSKPNQKLSEAVGQAFTYLYAIDKTEFMSIIKPKAYIVIGKKETDRPSERRVFSSYLSNIELITYFELYKRGKQLLKYLKDTYNVT